MSIPSSEVIAKTIDVLAEVCVLLDDEVDERTTDPLEPPGEARQFNEAAQAIRALIPKLETARATMLAAEPRG